MEQLPLGVRLRDSARFENFVIGRNDEAFRALAARAAPRIVWLWGRTGTGKTHLLQGACADTAGRGGSATYVDFADAARPAWLDGCETLDLVCLDGLEFVAGDPDWNAAIFRLHTLMQEGAGCLCVASEPPPSAVDFRLPDLGSRLRAAAVYQLHELDDSGRSEALQRRAAMRGLDLSADAALYLVHHLPRDMHSLFAALDRLDQAALAARRRLTVPFLRQALEDQASGRP